jgi:hypothetical protein
VNYLALGTVNAPRMSEIVGIVSNLRQRGLDAPSEPAVYVPYLQDETHHVLASMNLFVRSVGGDPGYWQTASARKFSRCIRTSRSRIMVMHDVVSKLARAADL